MPISLYQVDAFTRGPFTGNPAAVCPLKEWIDEEIMQNVAMENNLSETAFFVDEGNCFHLRWFTPTTEVKLCGHATLASAWVIYNILGFNKDSIQFNSLSGPLFVSNNEDLLQLDFPTDQLRKIPTDPILSAAFGVQIQENYRGNSDIIAVIENQDQLLRINPDFRLLKKIDARGIIVTAPGSEEFDFVSRGFFPQSGIDEDPATGSAHTSLTPYWSKRLNKNSLIACQLSKRKGFFHCENKGKRTLISGKCQLFLRGEIII